MLMGLLISIARPMQGQESTRDGSRNNRSATDKRSCIQVVGAIRAPACFELRRPARLLELLARAGGATEQAEGTILLVRSMSGIHGNLESVDVYTLAEVSRGTNENANPYLQPTDIVHVSEAKTIYITGSVVKPQAVYIKEPITLMHAIKLAGGLSPNAQTDDIRIYRQTPDSISKTVIKINPKQINKHRGKDVILQPNDIIEVVSKRRACCIPFFAPLITPTTRASLPVRIIE